MVPLLNFAGFVYSQSACHQVLIKVNLRKDETVLEPPASVLEFSVMYCAGMLEGEKILQKVRWYIRLCCQKPLVICLT